MFKIFLALNGVIGCTCFIMLCNARIVDCYESEMLRLLESFLNLIQALIKSRLTKNTF